MLILFEFHEDFEKDIRKLDSAQKRQLLKAYQKIKENPTRFKHLSGPGNCYSVRMGDFRIVYLVEDTTVTLLTIEKRAKVYGSYLKRLYTIREELFPYGFQETISSETS